MPYCKKKWNNFHLLFYKEFLTNDQRNNLCWICFLHLVCSQTAICDTNKDVETSVWVGFNLCDFLCCDLNRMLLLAAVIQCWSVHVSIMQTCQLLHFLLYTCDFILNLRAEKAINELWATKRTISNTVRRTEILFINVDLAYTFQLFYNMPWDASVKFARFSFLKIFFFFFSHVVLDLGGIL